jgi:N,N'-diacetyllegionaminate synthase
MSKNLIHSLNDFVISEIGTNHNQKKSLVKKMIREIAKTDCQCVKYQIYEPDELVNKRVMASEYGLNKYYGDISAYKMFDKYLKTPKQWFPELIHYASKFNLKTAATIHGDSGIRWAIKNKPHYIKIASMDHNNFPFINKIVRKLKIPVLVSLGMAKIEDIEKLVNILSRYKYGYGIFHCISLYPPKKSELRLRNIAFLKKKFNIPVGFSDHSTDDKISMMAKEYGATFFEKHITLNRKMIGPDHAFALNLKNLNNYVKKIKSVKSKIKKINIKKFLNLSEREKLVRKKYLKGLIVSKNLKKNTKITRKHIKILRPLANGLEPKDMLKIIGKKVLKSFKEDENFNLDYII